MKGGGEVQVGGRRPPDGVGVGTAAEQSPLFRSLAAMISHARTAANKSQTTPRAIFAFPAFLRGESAASHAHPIPYRHLARGSR